MAVGATLSGLVVTPGYIWVADESNSAIVGIATATNTPSITIDLPSPPVWFATTEGTRWVSGAEAQSVWRVDADSAQVTVTIPIDDVPLDLTAGGGYVWVPGQSAGNLTRIDPADNSVATLRLAPGIYVAEPVGDLIWVLDFSGSEVWIIGPGRET